MAKQYTHHVKTANKAPQRSIRGLPGLLLGISVGFVCWLLLMVITAAVLCKTADPARYVLAAALILAAIGAFVCGFASRKLSGFRPIVCGASAMLALISLAALLAQIAPSDTETAVVLRVAAAVVIGVFSFFGALSAEKRKRVGQRRGR